MICYLKTYAGVALMMHCSEDPVVPWPALPNQPFSFFLDMPRLPQEEKKTEILRPGK